MTTKSRNVFTYYVKRVHIYYFIQRHSVNKSEQCETCWAALPFILSWKNYSLMSVEAIPDSFMKERNMLNHGKHFWDAKMERKICRRQGFPSLLSEDAWASVTVKLFNWSKITWADL